MKLQSFFSAPPTPFNVKLCQAAYNSSSAFRTVSWMMPNISFIITDFIIILTNKNSKNFSIIFSTNMSKTNYSHQVNNSLSDQTYSATVIAISHGVLSSPSTPTDFSFTGKKYKSFVSADAMLSWHFFYLRLRHCITWIEWSIFIRSMVRFIKNNKSHLTMFFVPNFVKGRL